MTPFDNAPSGSASPASPRLSELEAADPFHRRHIGPAADDVAHMLAEVGYSSLDELIAAAVPEAIRLTSRLDLPDPITEDQVLGELRALAARNHRMVSMIGLGYSATITPSVLMRNILRNPGWYTAYTPYQPEISQGRLEALLTFQTMIEDLTGLPTANASLLDEATAAAEGMALAHRVAKSPSQVFVVDADTHPQTIAVLRTRAKPLGIEIVVRDIDLAAPQTVIATDDPHTPHAFGLLLSQPGSSGQLRDLAPVVAAAHDVGAVVVVCVDLLSLAVVTPPGEWGADVVVGSSQRFGVPLGFGGPHAAFMSVRSGLERQLPGRLVGVSVDADGAPAYRLALQTREQHIRREKATSNICTAQVLLAVMAAMYAVYHGPDGIRAIAWRTHRMAVLLAAGLQRAGVELGHAAYFDTIWARVPGGASDVVESARAAGINLRLVDADTVGISTSEATARDHVEAVWKAFGVAPVDLDALDATAASAVPEALLRTSDFFQHPVFHQHHNETSMLRYLRSLQDKDVALDRSMIPLGSCTMKLNATTEMEPITWPNFADIHPYAPDDQTLGHRELISQLEQWLVSITGYDAVSVQPNAGSQGEFAGLLAIRGYLDAQGQGQRDVCLIPSSAHGTNAASAAMAGLRVVVVACDEQGNVDLADLRRKIDEHQERLAVLMITYPSTHGVFEADVVDICAAVHDAGGQVYVDGANLNALVGVAQPGRFGADVSHLNLHKTFCIPHGGGGPGVGPIGVRSHLAPFLPSDPLDDGAVARGGVGPVAAARYGSAGVLPITWAYLRLMGPDGLLRATQVAVLSANYLAHRLNAAFPVLYTGANDLVAHECILDLREITKRTGITVDDVAKRLIDYGFHAPTMSFPVAGTLMVEPTESEDLRELDRFVDAMVSIRAEIDDVANGRWPADDNPLVNAPHPAHLLAGEWSHPYDRETAVYPVASLRVDKYWSPVRRIDGAYGDRHLVCTCPPVVAYATDSS